MVSLGHRRTRTLAGSWLDGDETWRDTTHRVSRCLGWERSARCALAHGMATKVWPWALASRRARVEKGSVWLELRGVATGVSAAAWQLACEGMHARNTDSERE
jgi:hypothetical protein